MRHKQGRKIVEKDVKMKDTVRPRRSTRQSSMKNKGESSDEGEDKRRSSLIQRLKKDSLKDAYDADFENSSGESGESTSAMKSPAVDLYDFSLSEEEESMRLVLSPIKPKSNIVQSAKSKKRSRVPEIVSDEKDRKKRKVKKTENVAVQDNNVQTKTSTRTSSRNVHVKKQTVTNKLLKTESAETVVGKRVHSKKRSLDDKASEITPKFRKQMHCQKSMYASLDDSGIVTSTDVSSTQNQSSQQSLCNKPRTLAQKHFLQHCGVVSTSTPSAPIKRSNASELDSSCFGFDISSPEQALNLSPVKCVTTPLSDYGSMHSSTRATGATSMASSTDLGSPQFKKTNITTYASPVVRIRPKSPSPSGFYLLEKEKVNEKKKAKKVKKPSISSKTEQMMEKLNAEFDEIEMHQLSIDG